MSNNGTIVGNLAVDKASVSIANAIGGATVVENGSALVAAIVNWNVPPQDSSIAGSVDWKIVSGAAGPALSDFFDVMGGTLTSPTSGALNFGPDGNQAIVIDLHFTPTANEPRNESFTIELLDPSASAVLGAASSLTIGFLNPAAGDLLFQNTMSGQASIWDVNGSTLVGGGTVSPDPGPSWTEIGAGDFNDDGHPDILWRNASSGQLSVWEMNGGALIGGGAVSPNPGPSWRAIGTGDFNDDSHSDILFQNASTGQAAVWEMSGNDVIGGGVVTPNPGPSWKAIGTGDFNDDGRSDILWQNADGQVSVWEMDGNTLIGGGAVTPNPGPAWKAIGTGDFNEDGHSDILFQNISTGQVSIWEMNGNKIDGWWTGQRQSRAKLACDRNRRRLRHPASKHSGQISIWEMSGANIVGGGPVSANPGPSWRAAGLT